jgi:hypothetical protein
MEPQAWSAEASRGGLYTDPDLPLLAFISRLRGLSLGLVSLQWDPGSSLDMLARYDIDLVLLCIYISRLDK